MERKRLIAVFDFDGTIIKKDSLIDFLFFSFSHFSLLKGIIDNFFVLCLAEFFINKRDYAKEKLFSYFFKNFSESDFNKLCRRYSLERVDDILKEDIKKKFIWHKRQGHELVIVSASIENWIKPWADKNGFDTVIATIPEISGGVITGKFKTKNCNREEKKIRFLEKYCARNEYFLYVYGDSRHDKEIFSIADEYFYC